MSEGLFDSAACLRQVRAGDAAAANEMVIALTPLVRKIVASHLPWRLAPEDLCQDIFVKVFGRLDQFAGGVPFEHWVARVALNTCRDQGRSEQRSREVRWSDLTDQEAAMLDFVVTDQQADGGASDTGDRLAARDLAERLMAALGPEDRLVVRMLDLEQCSAADVQAVTGWSITGIRVRAFRARRKLRKHLAQLQKAKRA